MTGITISQEQYRIARSRAPEPSSVRIEDYRNTRGTFDAIVSIEMFEAVGERYWPQYFKVLSERLKPKGVAMVQTITIRDDLFANYRATSDFIRHHVFPGGMLPSLSRFREEAGKQGLGCRDVYSFGLDYARTLREWLARFDKAESEILKLGYDQSFLRGWRFYLTLCAAAFETGRTNVHQIELAH